MKCLSFFVLFFICSLACASEIKLTSTTLNDTPKVVVKLPPSYKHNETQRYPILFILDGADNLALASSMLNRLHGSKGAYEHIVVGIESDNRLRDFTPTVNKDPRGPVGAGGGANDFLRFIELQLIPFIEENYRTTNQKSIAGHSVGGLFVIHAFHSRPNLFQGYLAFSPAVWWGKSETVEAAKKYVVSGKVTETYLYINIGNEAGFMRDIYDSFADTLVRNRSSDLYLKTDVYQGSGHDFTLAAGLYSALQGLYQYQQRTGGQ